MSRKRTHAGRKASRQKHMRQVEGERGLDLWIQTPSQRRLARAGVRCLNEARDDFGKPRPGGVSEEAKVYFASALVLAKPLSLAVKGCAS